VKAPPKGSRVDKAAEAVAAGHFWRAKEILRGRLRAHSFDPEVYEQLGLVLLRMGDHLEAGKFLLLSGKRTPEYEESIRVFIRRYAHAPWQNMLAAFPRNARRCSWSELPAQARADLEAAGVPKRPATERVSRIAQTGRNAKMGWVGLLLILLFFAAVGFVVAVLIVHFHYEV